MKSNQTFASWTRWAIGGLLLLGGGVLLWKLSTQYQHSQAFDQAVHQHLRQGLADTDWSARALAQLSTATQPAVAPLLQRMDQHLSAAEPLPALAVGQEALALDPDNLSVLLRLGMVYLQQRQYAEAETHLRAVHRAPTAPALRSAAAWHLALLYATYGEHTQTRALLREVAGAPHVYQQQARDLLALMKPA